MARLLHRLPIPTADTVVRLGEEPIRVKAYEILVWVSLSARKVQNPSRLPRFPALLDTAHTHNFTIQEEHLQRWAGFGPDALALGSGRVRHQGRRFPLRAAMVWLHPNEPGRWDRIADRPPYPLDLPEGILVYPAGSSFPRLPLLGLRALLHNKLRLVVDGTTGLVSLHTRSKWWPF
jgi:hypothetical protein